MLSHPTRFYALPSGISRQSENKLIVDKGEKHCCALIIWVMVEKAVAGLAFATDLNSGNSRSAICNEQYAISNMRKAKRLEAVGGIQ